VGGRDQRCPTGTAIGLKSLAFTLTSSAPPARLRSFARIVALGDPRP
jgi:hypothetical protein